MPEYIKKLGRVAAIAVLTSILSYNTAYSEETPAAGEANPAASTAQSDNRPEQSLFEKGVEQFRAENYEEALELLKRAYGTTPSNPDVAFYLGLASRETMDFKNAIKYMNEVLAINSSRAEAHFYIAEALYTEGSLEDALKEAQISVSANAMTAESYLLQGQILTKLNRQNEAVKAFELARAITRNSDLRPQADFSVATALYNSKDYSRAMDAFTDITIVYPDSDWAQFAHDYLDTLENLIPSKARLTVTAGLQYDDNVLAVPIDQTLVDAKKQGDIKKNLSLLTEFNLQRSDNASTRAFYAFSSSQYVKPNYDRSGGIKTFSQDTLTHTFSLLSTYNVSKSSMLSLLASFNNTTIDYLEYSDSFTVVPSFSMAIDENQFAQIYIRGKKVEQDSKFYSQKFSQGQAAADDRDSWEAAAGGGYTYAFKRDALVNARLEGVFINAQGGNWDVNGIRASAGISYGLIKNTLKANAYADIFEQMYRQTNASFGKKRTDTEINFQPSLEYTINKTWSINLSYGLTYVISNIDVYSYMKNQISANAEFRY